MKKWKRLSVGVRSLFTVDCGVSGARKDETKAVSMRYLEHCKVPCCLDVRQVFLDHHFGSGL